MVLPKVLMTSSGYPGLVLILEDDVIIIIIFAKGYSRQEDIAKGRVEKDHDDDDLVNKAGMK